MLLRVSTLALAFCFSCTSALAQPAPSVPFTKDASEVFEGLLGSAAIGFFGLNKKLVERRLADESLSRQAEEVRADGWWSRWAGENASGSVVAWVYSPALLDATRNHFEIAFYPPAETPMPQAVLSHLLATAQGTKIVGGDVLEATYQATQSSPPVCMQSSTLRIRLTSGALISTRADVVCPRPAGKE